MRDVLVLGGGFGGVAATRCLERLCGGRGDVSITLASRESYFVLTPLLFEACSGTLELRHCAQPIRPALRHARFVEATMEEVDDERPVVRAVAAGGVAHDLAYDQLVVALGGTTNQSLIPGSAAALAFKSMADAPGSKCGSMSVRRQHPIADLLRPMPRPLQHGPCAPTRRMRVPPALAATPRDRVPFAHGR